VIVYTDGEVLDHVHYINKWTEVVIVTGEFDPEMGWLKKYEKKMVPVFMDKSFGKIYREPIYWMPLPPPPEGFKLRR